MIEETFVLETDILMAEHKKELDALILQTDILNAEHKKELDALILQNDILNAEHKKELDALIEERNKEREEFHHITSSYEKKFEELTREIEKLKAKSI